ncbi:MAG TPA: hypothetical protein V6D12_15160 [Candidatus Obscuribacterales bacterium]
MNKDELKSIISGEALTRFGSVLNDEQLEGIVADKSIADYNKANEIDMNAILERVREILIEKGII